MFDLACQPMTLRGEHNGGDRALLRDRFANELIAGSSIEGASRAVGIDRRTGHRWLSDPAVAGPVRSARDDVRRQTVSQLVSACTAAVTTLLDVMATSKSDVARVQAAKCVLESSLAHAEAVELAERVAKLEESDTSATVSAAQLRLIVFGDGDVE